MAIVLALIVAGAAVSVAMVRHLNTEANHGSSAGHTRAKLPPPLRVVSASPEARTPNVAYRPTISLTFSMAIASNSPLPVLHPNLPGTWSRTTPQTLVFRPAAQFLPLQHVTVVVPGGAGGVVSSNGEHLVTGYASHFTVQNGSVLRLQQLLSELGYLPVAFRPSTAIASPGGESAPAPSAGGAAESALAAEPTVPDAISLSPLPGSFAWRYPSIPLQLRSLWTPGAFDVATEGAVMAFEADHGLQIDGVASEALWRDLVNAVAHRQATTRPYTWVVVSESDPETLYVWRGGRVIYQSLTNTGVAGAPTELGTWPVYLRFVTTTMTGHNPDGSYYSDPGIPWVSYFHGGDAVHGFVRGSYGFPQSDGCVELPIQNAAVVYPYDTYGTLVTVTTGNQSSLFGTTRA